MSPYIDEIVIVDGSPTGPSTDNTADIARSNDKVSYFHGTYSLPDGGWDLALQKNTAIGHAKGDVLVFMSADMFFSDLGILSEVLGNKDYDDFKLFFCSCIEFWHDVKHIRLYSQDGNNMLTIPGVAADAFAIDRELQPYYDENGGIQVDTALPEQRLSTPQLVRYHVGWIKDFRTRVNTHMTHVRQHRWGDEGETLLSGPEKEFYKWAIKHVLSYPQIPCIDFVGDLPSNMDICLDMKYNDGYDVVISEFETAYKTSVFKGWK